MPKLFASCVFLALAAPALAASSSNPSTQSHQNLAGKPVMDQQSHKIGKIDYDAFIDGQEAAVMTIPTALYGDATVALPVTDLQPAKNGGMTVSMSVKDLVRIPCALPPCRAQNSAS
jgi:hypothetical protein